MYTEAGPRDGIPVVYCHGAIGTPLGGSVNLDTLAWDLGIRHIAISRPGIGGSDPKPGRTVVGFADDLDQFADALALSRFHVIGVSAGGPYALAAAHRLRDRVRRAAVVSSLSPLCAPQRTPGMQRRIRLALAFVAREPDLCAAVGDWAVPVIRRHPELLSRVIAAHAAPSERLLLEQSGERRAASSSFLDAASGGGVRGMIDDYLTYCSGWGFSPAEIDASVHLWHGLNDLLVPIEHALQLAATLPRCDVFFDPEEGHHFFRRRLQEILAVLIGRREGLDRSVATSMEDARELAQEHRGHGSRRRPAR